MELSVILVLSVLACVFLVAVCVIGYYCYSLQKKVSRLTEEKALLSGRIEGLQKEGEAREKLKKEFELLASHILEEKGKKFSDASKELLTPLREQLGAFQKRIEDVHEKNIKSHSSLFTKIDEVQNLHQQLSTDAKELTTALHGKSQSIGAWGEMILEKILEGSGLKEGAEYKLQSSFRGQNNEQLRPDAVIHLPRERDVVVDSKLSLVHYQASMARDISIEEREKHLKEHARAMRKHMLELSDKYAKIPELRTLDATLMFVPIEGALADALRIEKHLQEEAFARGLVLTSPSTLMVVLKSIYHIWSADHRERKADKVNQEILAFLDKIGAFTGDLDKVGESLGRAQKNYDDAYKKLVSGRGSVADRAEKIRDLGYFTSKKTLPK